MILGKFIKVYATKLNWFRTKIGLRMQLLVTMNECASKTYVHTQRQHDIMFKAIEIWSSWMSYEINRVW